MYQVGQNLYDDPNGDGFNTPVRVSVRPTISFPFQRYLQSSGRSSADIFVDQYVQQYDAFSPQTVGTCHPYLKKQISGTIAVTRNSDQVVGTDTDFLSQFLADDIIWINGESRSIQSVESDTALTLKDLYDGLTASGMLAYRAECFLTEEGGFGYMENGLMEFSRTYASLPEGRVEWGTTGFTFPAYRNASADTGTPIRRSFNQVVVARNTYSYIRTNAPATDLTIESKFESLDADGNIVQFVASDTTPTRSVYEGYVTASSYIRAFETKVDPWMGNIWQMLNIEVIAK